MGIKSIMEEQLPTLVDRPTRCGACDQQFLSATEKRNHLNDGSCPGPVAKYDCPHCNKSFFKKVVLKNHIMTHTGERPYLCTVCGQKFRRSHHRKRHMEGVHNVSPKSRLETRKTNADDLKNAFVTPEEANGKLKPKNRVNGVNNPLKMKNLKSSSQSSAHQRNNSAQKSTNPHSLQSLQSSHNVPYQMQEKFPVNNNNLMPGSVKSAGAGGGYITVPPQFGPGKQSSVLNIPLQNVTQMFTVSGQLGDVFPLMSSMINSDSSVSGHTTDPNTLIETSVSFPEITNAWSNMIEDDSNPYKCFLCSVRFSSQCDLELHLHDHVNRGDIPNGES